MRKLLPILIALSFAIQSYAQTCTPTFTTSQIPGQGNNLLQGKINFTYPTNLPNNQYRYYDVYWGDGQVSSSTSVPITRHNYTTPGTYTVKIVLTIADANRTTTYCKDSTNHNVTVNYTPCSSTALATVSTQNNGLVTFTANTPPGTSNMTYVWIYGDGTLDTTTSTTITHTYPYSSSFSVRLVAISAGCSYINDFYIHVKNGCGLVDFTANTNNGLNAQLINTSSHISGYITTSNWDFGDGSTSTQTHTSHLYSGPGTYNVRLITTWIDSSFTQTYCIDTVTKPITVTGSSIINGDILTDSNILAQPAFKVWLITYDSTAQTLAAIDSLILPSLGTSTNLTSYHFNNVPQGVYRVKAAVTNGPTSGTGYVPTYHDSELLWSNASIINHTTGSTSGKRIWMKKGTVTTGHGFVAGNVTQGANKGTSGGIQGMGVYLLDNNNQLIQSAITDASGSFSFSQVPNGTYKVHPEQMNYTTTDASITITNGQASFNGINFERSHSQKTIAPKTLNIANVAAKSINFSIYPNPTNGVVTIEIKAAQRNDNATIFVTDVTGKNILTTITNKDNTQLDLSQLQKGLYFITIKANNSQQTQKLLIQ